jgi:hypothetical protein
MTYAIHGMARITMYENAEYSLCAQMYRELAHMPRQAKAMEVSGKKAGPVSLEITRAE